MTQEPTNPAIDRLLGTVRAEVEGMIQPLVTEREEAVLRIAHLEKQLEEAAPAPSRQALEINPGFDAEVHLEPQQRAIRKELYEWIDHMIRQSVEPISRGMEPGSVNSKTPLMHGQMHARAMRNVGHIVNSLAHILERWGDPAAWERLDRVIKVIWDHKRLATKHDPGAKVIMVPALVDGKQVQVSDEQPGLMRFNFQTNESGEGSDPDYVGTDIRHDLDFDLTTAVTGLAKLAAKHNLAHGGGESYKLLRRYADDLIARMKFATYAYDSSVRSGKRKWYVKGKSLRHPSRARHTFHRAEYLDLGDPEQAEAADFYGKMLASDVDIVMVEGVPVATASHEAQALRDARGQSRKSWGHQDVTYKREDAPLELMLYRLGDPHVTLDFLAATANSNHMIVMFEGSKGDRISSSLGGNGPTADNGKKVVSYKGKTYPTKRAYQGRAHSTEDIFQMTRGLQTIQSFAAGNVRYFRHLIDLSDRKDSSEHHRFGARVALMEWLTPQRLVVG